MVNENDIIELLNASVHSCGYQSVSGIYEAVSIIENYVAKLKVEGKYIDK